MYKIMFVCHGNICRSPMAEFMLKDAVRRLGKTEHFLIESSAVSTEEIWNGVGNPVYPPAKAELKKAWHRLRRKARATIDGSGR